jgi:hypothetical protein
MRPFFAMYDPKAIWLSDLRPAFGEPRFFFEEELGKRYREDNIRRRRSKPQKRPARRLAPVR